MIQVGIIGAGNFGEVHARAIKELPSLRLVAACRTNRQELEKFKKKYDIQGHVDYRDLLRDPKIDAVVIATPHHLHTSIALNAAKAGKHILLEKPLAPSLEECDQIIGAAKQAQVQLMVGHNKHFNRSSIIAKRLLDSGTVGEVVMGLGIMSKFWMVRERKSWHLTSHTAGGMLITAGIHYIDLLTFLIGSKVRSVRAEVSAKFNPQEADDAAMVFLQYQNGVTATVISTGYSSGAQQMEAELFCTEGVLKIDSRKGVFIGRDEKWKTVPKSGSEDWMHDSVVNEWSEFTDSIQKNREPAVTGDYAKHIIQVVNGAFDSSRLSKEIYLDQRN